MGYKYLGKNKYVQVDLLTANDIDLIGKDMVAKNLKEATLKQIGKPRTGKNYNLEPSTTQLAAIEKIIAITNEKYNIKITLI